MGYINGLQDVMNYYYFAMIPFYCLTVINLVVAVSVKEWERGRIKFAIIQTGVFLSLISKFYFLGVLADNNADIQKLTTQMAVLTGFNIIWLITGMIRMRKKK